MRFMIVQNEQMSRDDVLLLSSKSLATEFKQSGLYHDKKKVGWYLGGNFSE